MTETAKTGYQTTYTTEVIPQQSIAHNDEFYGAYTSFMNGSPSVQAQADMMANAYTWQRNEIARLRSVNRRLRIALVALLLAGTIQWLSVVVS